MANKMLKGSKFAWHHIAELEDKDFAFLKKDFKFHPLDFDDLRNDTEIPKLEVYKDYLFAIFTIPTFDSKTQRVEKINLGIFIGKNYLVTVASAPIESVDRFFARAKRSKKMRDESMGKTTGFLLYHLLDYIFRDSKVILQELVREVNNVELAVYDERTKVTTKRLGIVRRNVLFMQHVIDPQRILLNQILSTKKPFLSKDLNLYYEDVKDTLDSMWVITGNLKNIVDGLFDVNEAFLTHKTNEIIRLLTVISVILMPPTLITGYFGMNFDNLPFSGNVGMVTLIIILSILVFWFAIIRIDKR